MSSLLEVELGKLQSPITAHVYSKYTNGICRANLLLVLLKSIIASVAPCSIRMNLSSIIITPVDSETLLSAKAAIGNRCGILKNTCIWLHTRDVHDAL